MNNSEEKFVNSILKVIASDQLDIAKDIATENPEGVTIDKLLNEKTKKDKK